MAKKILSAFLIFNLAACPFCFEALSLEPAEASSEVSPAPAQIEEEPALQAGYVTVNFKGADIKAVLNYLSDVGGLDIVPAPDVEGPVTLKLTNKPWETALDIIVRNYGYAYERENNIIRVVTVNSLKLEELSTEVVRLNYADAALVMPAIQDMLSERGKIKPDPRTNTLVITDIPTYIYKIKQIVEKLDKKTPQIMIEAKIIETVLDKSEKMGIDWTIKVAATGAKRPHTIPFMAFNVDWGLQSKLVKQFLPVGTTGTATSIAGSGVATTTASTGDYPTGEDVVTDHAARSFPFVDTEEFTFGTLDFSQFAMVLEYLKQRTDTEIISNPRITTLNNKAAKIFVGGVYNFPTYQSIEQTNQWRITGYDSKELGIRLLVTPHVNEEDQIVVSLKPEISNWLGMEKISADLSAPKWSSREAETEVMVKDGDTIFIGGLIRENINQVDKRFPILGDLFGDLPLLQYVLKYKQNVKSKTELIFFITVRIVTDVKAFTKDTVLEEGAYIPIDERKSRGAAHEVNKAVGPPEKKSWFNFSKKRKSI